jgi:hypothetical protein
VVTGLMYCQTAITTIFISVKSPLDHYKKTLPLDNCCAEIF